MSNRNHDDLRDSLVLEEFETEFDVVEKQAEEIDTGRIFGLTAGERMMLAIILFLAVTVLSGAILLATGTIAL